MQAYEALDGLHIVKAYSNRTSLCNKIIGQYIDCDVTDDPKLEDCCKKCAKRYKTLLTLSKPLLCKMAHEGFYAAFTMGRARLIGKWDEETYQREVLKIRRDILDFMNQNGFIEHDHVKDAEGGWPYNDYADIPYKITQKGIDLVS